MVLRVMMMRYIVREISCPKTGISLPSLRSPSSTQNKHGARNIIGKSVVVQGYEVTSEEHMVSRDVSLTDQHRVYAVAEHAPCHENHFSISMDAYLLSHGIAISHPLWS